MCCPALAWSGEVGLGRGHPLSDLLGLDGSQDVRHPALKPGPFQADRDSHPSWAELLHCLVLLREARISASFLLEMHLPRGAHRATQSLQGPLTRCWV